MARKPQQRSEVRRESILAAALKCFRTEGFHGAGIAAICKEAGISPGHLYHYFDSKEAIVEAIVQEDRARVIAVIAEVRSQPNPIEALLAMALAGMRDDMGFLGFALDPVLTVEIFAEAARNPRIAGILATFDRDARAEVAALLKEAQGRGEVDGSVDVEVAASLMLVLVDGMLSRSVSDPTHDGARLAPGLKRMLLACLAA